MVILIVLAALLLLFFLLRFLYDRRWDNGLSCTLSFRDEYAVEDEVSALTEVLVNDKHLPLPVVEIDFHMDKRLRFADGQNASVSDQSYRRDVFALSVRQKITRTLEFQCAGRGWFRISEAGIMARDLFLTRKYLASQPQHTEFYVLPRPVPVQQISIPFSRIMGAVLSRKKIYDDPFEFAGLREYSRSDPMKYINWKATARAGEMLTNLHESTLSQKVVILLDMEGRSDPLNEDSVRIACALSERLLREGVELDIYSNGTDAITGGAWKLEGVSGAGSLLFLKKRFACVQADNGLAEICGCFPERTGQEDLLVLVSRSQRQELADAFSNAVGKGRGVHVIPCRAEHKELAPLRNVDLVWTEV